MSLLKYGKMWFISLVVLMNAAWAQDLVIEYFTTGVNGGPPTKTLMVYSDGSARLIINTFSDQDTLSGVLDPAALKDLTDRFVQNGWSALDSQYYSGCLACPEFSIAFDGKKVSGNAPAANDSLRNITSGLNDIIAQLETPVGIWPVTVDRETNDKPVSWRPYLIINIPGLATQCGILECRDPVFTLYNLKGNRLGRRDSQKQSAFLSAVR